MVVSIDCDRSGTAEAGLFGIDVLAPICGVAVACDQSNCFAPYVPLEHAVVSGVGKIQIAIGVECQALGRM